MEHPQLSHIYKQEESFSNKSPNKANQHKLNFAKIKPIEIKEVQVHRTRPMFFSKVKNIHKLATSFNRENFKSKQPSPTSLNRSHLVQYGPIDQKLGLKYNHIAQELKDFEVHKHPHNYTQFKPDKQKKSNVKSLKIKTLPSKKSEHKSMRRLNMSQDSTVQIESGRNQRSSMALLEKFEKKEIDKKFGRGPSCQEITQEGNKQLVEDGSPHAAFKSNISTPMSYPKKSKFFKGESNGVMYIGPHNSRNNIKNERSRDKEESKSMKENYKFLKRSEKSLLSNSSKKSAVNIIGKTDEQT